MVMERTGDTGERDRKKVIPPYLEMDLKPRSTSWSGLKWIVSLVCCYTSAPEVPVPGALLFSHVWHILSMPEKEPC